MSKSQDFQNVFKRLRKILVPYARKLVLVHDTPNDFFINTKHILKNKKPMYFGSVKINKNYVSFHLMPVYVFPELLDSMSPALARRMQGKSCFNFKSVDEKLFDEISALTNIGYMRYKESGYL